MVKLEHVKPLTRKEINMLHTQARRKKSNARIQFFSQLIDYMHESQQAQAIEKNFGDPRLTLNLE